MDAGACGVAAFMVEKSVSIADATGINEFFAFVVNRIIVVPHQLKSATTDGLFKMASLYRCEETGITPLS